MNKRKVMYISNESGLGGAMQSLLDLITGLDNYVEAVLVIPSKGDIVKWLEKKKILYFIIPFVSAFGKTEDQSEKRNDHIFVNNYEAALKIADIVKEQKIQMIHSNSVVINVGAIAAFLASVPHIWHLRELVEEDFGCELYDKVFKKELFEFTDAYISVSRCVRDIYLQKYGIHSEHIYDGLNGARYKKELGIFREHNKIFLLAGRIQHGKGQWDAIKAIEILVKEGETGFSLIIVGNGSQKYVWAMKRYVMENELEEYIHFLPGQKDLSDLRNRCSFSLTTSKMEALGRVTIEGMLAGNIVIGANTGGTLEIIGCNQTRGYLYRQGNPTDLALVMRMAVETEGVYRERLRKNAQEYAEQCFDLDNYVEKIIHLYDDVWMNKKYFMQNEKERTLKKIRERYEKLKKGSINLDTSFAKECEKWKHMFFLMERWLKLKQDGCLLEHYFLEKGLKKIAIYGMGYLGCDLYDELDGGKIQIQYVIDKRGADLKDVVNVVSPESELKKVDAIVIAVLEEEEQIGVYLEKTNNMNIVMLSDIISWMESR